jgi:hypothetical protein
LRWASGFSKAEKKYFAILKLSNLAQVLAWCKYGFKLELLILE